MRVKVCGITRLEDALLAADLGADAIGFVCWPESPRFVDPDTIRAIVRALPPLVATVGVFVDQDVASVRDTVQRAGILAVQLHGHERPEEWVPFDRPLLKAIGVGRSFRLAMLDAWPASITVLLDAADGRHRGGTGRTIDWDVARAAASIRRIVLAGGLRPENVGDAIRRVRPFGVDVSSGVEIRPGVKDAGRLRAFMDAVASATG
jgi:phosphoribosylanthranilate isomerase